MDAFFLLVLALPIVVIAAAMLNSTLRRGAEDQPRGFPWIMLLFGVGVAGGIALCLTLARGRQELVIRITGPAGKAFVGQAEVDGALHEIKGVAPDDLQFVGRTFGVVVLADEPEADRPLEVAFAGDFSGIALNDMYGVRFGAFKKLLSGGAACTPVSEEEWNDWMQRLGRPIEEEEPEKPLLPGMAAPSDSDSTNEQPPDATNAPGGM